MRWCSNRTAADARQSQFRESNADQLLLLAFPRLSWFWLAFSSPWI